MKRVICLAVSDSVQYPDSHAAAVVRNVARIQGVQFGLPCSDVGHLIARPVAIAREVGVQVRGICQVTLAMEVKDTRSLSESVNAMNAQVVLVSMNQDILCACGMRFSGPWCIALLSDIHLRPIWIVSSQLELIGKNWERCSD